METIQTYMRRGQTVLRRIRTDRRFYNALRVAVYTLTGFLLSAGSIRNMPLPLPLALLCASAGWPSVCIAVGGVLGYWCFWGSAFDQGVMWLAAGMLAVLIMGDKPVTEQVPLLRPAVAALITAVVGLVSQIWLGDTTSVAMYLLRLALAAGATRCFDLTARRKDPIADWLSAGIGVLALAQVIIFQYVGLGYVAAGALAIVGTFPAAALAGLALDLAQITAMPMTAVACVCFFLRLLPGIKRWLLYIAPGVVYIGVMAACGKWDIYPLAGLLLGGVVAFFLPGQKRIAHRRGETGVAQVRLEMVANTFSQTQQLLLEVPEVPVDLQTLLLRTEERACNSCPCKKGCKNREQVESMDPQILYKPLLNSQDLPFQCRKSGRLLQELRRTQELLRTITADRKRQAEYRSAVIQQYRFLYQYLQTLSDSLGRRTGRTYARYKPEVSFCANRKGQENGDRCFSFAGVGHRHYVVLCDGMGTGLGAAEEGRIAGGMLKKLLTAGFPAEHALQSLNSLCALRGAAGAATVDLCELELDSGKGCIYKWGAAPSYLLSALGTEKIGTATPPPGLSVTESRETAYRLSLRRGETLVMLSDGVGGEDALRLCFAAPDMQPEDLAAMVLDAGSRVGSDDATVAVVRLLSDLPR